MDFKALLNNQVVRYILILLVGVTVGALFYPTKHIEERVSQKYESEISTLKESHLKEVKDVQEKLDKTVAESKQFKEESDKKVSTLTVQIKDLQSKQKTAYYKIVRPDGTIEIKKFTETEVNESTKVVTQIQEEFKRKVESIETKWETIHKERVTKIQKDFDSKEQAYQKQISELKSEKITDINPKRFGLEAGMLLNRDYYGHVTADVWGPLFVGVHGQFGQSSSMGVGLGIRF